MKMISRRSLFAIFLFDLDIENKLEIQNPEIQIKIQNSRRLFYLYYDQLAADLTRS